MRKYWAQVLLLLVIAGLLLGAVTNEDYVAVRVDNFNGIGGGEYSGDFSRPTDMVNFEIKKGAAGSYLSQRRGFGKLYKGLPHGYAATHLSLFQSSSQEWLVVIANDTLWTANDPDEDWSAKAEMTFNPFHKGFMFKDTLILSGSSDIMKIPPFNDDSLETDWDYAITTLHQDRVYGAGAGGKIVWGAEFDIGFSAATWLTNDDAGFVYVGSSDEKIWALHSLGGNLVAYTSRSIYYITISPTTNEPYEVVRINANIGVLNNDAVTSYGGKHYFINEDRGVFSFDGVNVKCISRAIDDWFSDSTYSSGSAGNDACIVGTGGKLFVCSPIAGTDAEDGRLFVYDIEGGTWTKFTMPVSRLMLAYQRGDGTALKLPNDVSTRDGDYKLIFTSEKTFDDTTHVFIYPWLNEDTGKSITSQYMVRATDLGDMWHRKQIVRASVALQESDATGTVSLKWYADSAVAGGIQNSFNVRSVPTVRHQRVDPRVEGSAIGFQLITTSCDSLQIYGIELGIRRLGGGLQD